MLWLVYSSQSRGFPDSVLQSDQFISVLDTDEMIHFTPNEDEQATGFIFYPGAMVDPKAYAPMARELAERGFSVYIVKLPLRLAPWAQQEARVMTNTLEIMSSRQSIQQWVVGGHSRGGVIASHFAHNHREKISGLILIGTSHPKEDTYDLSQSNLTVMKIYGTNDGLASLSEIEQTSHYLPDDTIWIEIEGGNHAQFGYYGSQLGDEPADISREEQQQITVSAILTILEEVGELK